MNKLYLIVVLFALGCSGDFAPSATDSLSSTGGASSEVHDGSAGSSFGGAPGAAPTLTVENLDLPARLERARGAYCWEGSMSATTCDAVPELEPAIVEEVDGKIVLRVPPGVCAQYIARLPDGYATLEASGKDGIEEVALPTEPKGWRVWLREGDCMGMGGGGGS